MMAVWQWMPPAGPDAYGSDLKDNSHNLFVVDPSDGRSPQSMRASAAPFLPSTPEGSVVNVCITNVSSRAFGIKDPKTGEVITRSALLEKAGELPSGPRCGNGGSGGGMTAVQKAKWQAAAGVVTRYMRQGRWSADHSTFSALNVDEVRLSSGGAPRQGQQKASAAAVAGRQSLLEAPASAALAQTPVLAQGAEAQKPQLEPAPAKGTAPVAEEPQEEPDLGSFFKAPKGKAPKTKKVRRSSSSPLNEGNSADDEEPEPESLGNSVPVAAEPENAFSASTETCSRASSCVVSVEGTEGIDSIAEVPAEEARSYLLSFRSLVLSLPTPPAIENLFASEVEGAPLSLASGDDSTPVAKERSSEGSWRSSAAPPRSPGPLTPSANAYRPKGLLAPEGLCRLDELKRSVQSLLNKVCPESVASIAEKIGEIRIESADELRHVIGQIFQKAVTEPHYIETYADLVFSLKAAWVAFPDPDGGSKPLTFKALLLNICQDEFESLPTTLSSTGKDDTGLDPEEIEFRRKRTKDRVLANMKFIGHLFLRQMLSARVIGSVVQELTLCNDADRVPEEHVIECAVELLLSIGHTLESMPAGKHAVTQVCGRLLDLKQRKGKDKQGVYCKRVQFAIQDLLDARNAGWARKVFGGVAKTKEEIRLEQERELSALARGKDVDAGEVIISGQRPLYMTAKCGDRS